MQIKGFVHQSEEDAFLANVRIVKDIRFYAGENVGHMELSNSDEVVLVRQHPSGSYIGQIVKEV